MFIVNGVSGALLHCINFRVATDPFCGSGTLLIEAALHALRIAPGLRRRFAAERWGSIPEEIWREERSRAQAMILTDRPFVAYGSDIDENAVALTKENARKAGVGARIRVERRDVSDFTRRGEKGIVLCNPPYGERLLDLRQAQELYRIMGKQFERSPGWSYGVISPDDTFEDCFGRKADKRRKLYNGMIKCQFYLYFQ